MCSQNINHMTDKEIKDSQEKLITSIVCGLISMTESNKIKWVDAGKESMFNRDLEYYLQCKINDEIPLKIYLTMRRNWDLLNGYLSIDNKKFQKEYFTINTDNSKDFGDLAILIHKKYILPNLSNSSKNIQTDLKLLDMVDKKVGISASREGKIDDILDEHPKKKFLGIFK